MSAKTPTPPAPQSAQSVSTHSTAPEFSTPMMLQYLEVKRQHPDCLLWFRLGDFYEMFLEDAQIGSDVLNITLTSRARGKDGRIPMAGIPYHAADTYLAKLIQAGHKVAICEQLSEPDGKNLVEREVIRIVTPGTLLDEKNLRKKEHNYLMSVSLSDQTIGIAAADLSTGDFRCSEFTWQNTVDLEQIFSDVVTQINPAECILPPDLFDQPVILRLLKKFKNIPTFPYADWEKWTAEKNSEGEKAEAALLGYLRHTQKTQVTHLHPVQPILSEEYLHMDRSTIANLELLNTLREGQVNGSLINVIDFTQTAMGGRLLKQWLLKPLVNKKNIEARLDAVEFFLKNARLRQLIQEQLKEVSDIERLLARLSVKLGNPRDIKNIELSLITIRYIDQLLKNETGTPHADKIPAPTLPPLLKNIEKNCDTRLDPIIVLITKTLLDQPPIDPKNGGLIAAGVDKKLDELRNIVQHNRDWMLEHEMQERQKTGISSLKIKFNQVFGFYIEISKSNLHLVPKSYMRKQTLVNAERFMTAELKEHEEIILTAEEEMNDIEYRIFVELVEKILMHTQMLQAAANAIAEIDCLISFTELAEKYSYTRPEILTSGEIEILEGRHPVIERLLEDRQFVPNSVELNHSSQQLLLLTGPNMAGKSVFMRQVALITLLAHLGSYIPARKAKISLTDQIFVRSGAADMITAGLSTFMVEMVETAYILNHATERSLIIMDEIGRGTSTYDGISIAWSVAEYLVNHGPKTLFATHYHELQDLENHYPGKIRNFHMAITEHQSKPVFLYKLSLGGASHSFGVAVAQLAGLPAPVIKRAEELLKDLEKRNKNNKSKE